MVVDPLGLDRCVVCTNAFVFDAAYADPDGDFVCRYCFPRVKDRVLQDYGADDFRRGVRRATRLRDSFGRSADRTA